MHSLRLLIRSNQCFARPYVISSRSLAAETRYQRRPASKPSEDSSDDLINVNPTTGNKRDGSRISEKPVVGILGGGISGLSAAYYLAKNYGDYVQPVLFEKSDRVGGWVNTVTGEGGSKFEMGPRTMRPVGIAGLNTLDLIEELGLDKDVLFIQKNHPTAKNRCIFVGGKIVKLPSDAQALFKKVEPFSKPLMFSVLKDLVSPRKISSDESIYSFVKRRFGNEVADYLVDPIIRGISGGDARSISVKFLLKDLFEIEKKYRSIIMGHFISSFKDKQKCKLTQEEKTIGFSKIAVASINGSWAVWSLEQGLGYLPFKLEEYLNSKKVQIRKNTNVQSVHVNGNSVNVKFYTHNDEKRSDLVTCDHIISTIPGMQLSTILKSSEGLQNSKAKLVDLMGSIKSVDLQVTGLTYKEDIIEENAFGFLVPSIEKSVDGLLGIVYDTCSFPQGDKTVITVMSRSEDGSMESIEKIKWYVEKTLGVKSQPVEFRTEMLRNCIPQYNVGHYDKIDQVRDIIKEADLPITLAGASWDGVSVNDCIYSGRKAATRVEKLIDKTRGLEDQEVIAS